MPQGWTDGFMPNGSSPNCLADFRIELQTTFVLQSLCVWLCKTTTQWPCIVLQNAKLSYDVVEGTRRPADSSCLVASSRLGQPRIVFALSVPVVRRSPQNTGAMPSSIWDW